MAISILVPTRRRPRNIDRFIESFYQNARSGDILESIEFLFYIDFCDELSLPELEHQKEQYKDLVNIRWIIGERTAISDMYNRLYEQIVNPDIILISGDDCLCRTEAWDLVVEETFSKYKDRLVLVGGKDLLNESLFTSFFISKEYIDILGFVMPSGFWDYGDTWHWDLCSRINRIHKIDIIIEHIHPTSGKCLADSTMKEKNLRCYGGGQQSSHILYEAEKGRREELAEKIRNKIKEKI